MTSDLCLSVYDGRPARAAPAGQFCTIVHCSNTQPRLHRHARFAGITFLPTVVPVSTETAQRDHEGRAISGSQETP